MPKKRFTDEQVAFALRQAEGYRSLAAAAKQLPPGRAESGPI